MVQVITINLIREGHALVFITTIWSEAHIDMLLSYWFVFVIALNGAIS